jgi:hypothetical protein
MKWTAFFCVLLFALTGCNAAKQVNPQPQYVPAITGHELQSGGQSYRLRLYHWHGRKL